MNTWILILSITFVNYGFGDPGTVTLESVPGFRDRESCLVAGNAWLRHQDTAFSDWRKPYWKLRALCVETGVAKK